MRFDEAFNEMQKQKTICIPKPSHSGKFIYKTDRGEVIRFEYWQTADEYEASKKERETK